MTKEAIEARRAYKREWNRKNKDRVKEHQRRYWERKARKMKEQAINGVVEPTEEEILRCRLENGDD